MSFAFHGFSQDCLEGQAAWVGGSVYISAQLVKDTWSATPVARYLADIPIAHRPITRALLGGRLLADGAADCADIIFPKVPAAAFAYQGVVFFYDTGVEASSRLIIFHDEGDDWPVTPNGGNIVILPSDGPDRLFRIGTYPCP
jgi:hypothetical protein